MKKIKVNKKGKFIILGLFIIVISLLGILFVFSNKKNNKESIKGDNGVPKYINKIAEKNDMDAVSSVDKSDVASFSGNMYNNNGGSLNVFVFDKPEQAKQGFYTTKKSYSEKKVDGSKEEFIEDKKFLSYELNVSGKYYYVCAVDKTLIYTSSISKDEINKIIKDFKCSK